MMLRMIVKVCTTPSHDESDLWPTAPKNMRWIAEFFAGSLNGRGARRER